MRQLLLSLILTASAWAISREEIIFRTTPQGELKMTVFYPDGWKATDKRPGIVFFFGGGFIGGETKQFFSKSGYLASRGMVAASAEYRIKNKHKTTPEDSFLDCQAAFGWLKEHATEQGIDPQKLSAGGGSAGGTCALSIWKAGVKLARAVQLERVWQVVRQPVLVVVVNHPAHRRHLVTASHLTFS